MSDTYEFIALDAFFGPARPINIVINLPSGSYPGDGGGGGDPSPPPAETYPDGLLLDGQFYLALDATNYLALT
jgi:hypothetical protein